MARYSGQISGKFSQNYELMNTIGATADRLVKVGIQLAPDYAIKINGDLFEMGKTGILELENVEITSLQLKHKGQGITGAIPVIIDYVYEKDEQEI